MAGALAKWQARYRNAQPGHREPDPLIVRVADQLPAGHALDLACGAGRHALYLAARGWRVTAVDGAPAALDLFDAPGIDKLCLDLETDLETGPLALTADLAVCVLYLDRPLLFRLAHHSPAVAAVAIVLPMPDDDPAVAPMNPAYLIEPDELHQAFRHWHVLHTGVRKQPGSRRVTELLARRP